MPSRIKLDGVTLVVMETRRRELAAIALADFLDKCVPEKTVVLSNDINGWPNGAYFEPLGDAPSKREWERQFWHEVPKYVDTSHMLFLEWDAGLVNPTRWDPSWLSYDYVGAVWPWEKPGTCVGNGGFSLRSRRLMVHLARHYQFETPVDGMICINYRPGLEREGFRWAPAEVARRFAVEWEGHALAIRYSAERDLDSFGYHGVFNWPRVLTIEQMTRRLRIAMADPYFRDAPGMLKEFDLTMQKVQGALEETWCKRS